MEGSGPGIDLKLLHTFVTAARLGSLTLAAERLFLAQPTVTVHIARLEEQLGYTLFERSHSGVILSAAGRRFLPHALRTLNALEAGLEDLVTWSQGYTTRLSLLVSPLIAATALPPLLRRFTGEHPEAEISLDVRQSVEIGHGVAEGAADLGLSLMVPAERGLVTETLYGDPVILVAPCIGRCSDQPAATYTDVLRRHTLFTHNHPDYWEDLLLSLRQAGIPLRTMKVSEMHVTRRLVEEGLGVSFLPRSVVARELAEGLLMAVDTAGLRLPEAHTYLVCPEQPPGPAAVAFASMLRRHYGIA